jgi:polysaccharide biosynthesis protein PslH
VLTLQRLTRSNVVFAVAVAPMLYGAGIQNKILEAMASGVPVVSTSRACGSLLARIDRDLLVGDGAEAIAPQIVRVLDEPDLSAGLAAAGRRFVEQRHGWRDAARRLAGVYEEAREARAGRGCSGGRGGR